MISNIIKIFIIVLVVFGCSATKLSYRPKDNRDIAQSIAVVKESLKYQSPNHKVHSVEIHRDYIKVISEPNSRIRFIHFDSIKDIELHEKDDWNIVTIRGIDNSVFYRLYVESDEIARNFIDAIYTLKIHSNEIE